jgi:hypothetical protein
MPAPSCKTPFLIVFYYNLKSHINKHIHKYENIELHSFLNHIKTRHSKTGFTAINSTNELPAPFVLYSSMRVMWTLKKESTHCHFQIAIHVKSLSFVFDSIRLVPLHYPLSHTATDFQQHRQESAIKQRKRILLCKKEGVFSQTAYTPLWNGGYMPIEPM